LITIVDRLTITTISRLTESTETDVGDRNANACFKFSHARPHRQIVGYQRKRCSVGLPVDGRCERVIGLGRDDRGRSAHRAIALVERQSRWEGGRNTAGCTSNWCGHWREFAWGPSNKGFVNGIDRRTVAAVHVDCTVHRKEESNPGLIVSTVREIRDFIRDVGGHGMCVEVTRRATVVLGGTEVQRIPNQALNITYINTKVCQPVRLSGRRVMHPHLVTVRSIISKNEQFTLICLQGRIKSVGSKATNTPWLDVIHEPR